MRPMARVSASFALVALTHLVVKKPYFSGVVPSKLKRKFVPFKGILYLFIVLPARCACNFGTFFLKCSAPEGHKWNIDGPPPMTEPLTRHLLCPGYLTFKSYDQSLQFSIQKTRLPSIGTCPTHGSFWHIERVRMVITDLVSMDSRQIHP